MGNDPSKVSSNNNGGGMGSRFNSTAGGGGGMGRRTTSSFENVNNHNNNDDDESVNTNNQLRSQQHVSSSSGDNTTNGIPRNLITNRTPAGNASGPNRQDFFSTPRTCFLEFSWGAAGANPQDRSQFDVLGRVEIELFAEVQKASEQFFLLCTGERGKSATKNINLHYKNTKAHRIIPGFLVCQAGDIENQNGTGKECLYTGEESEKEFPGRSLKHFPYCVACAHDGHTWSAQFYILSGKTQGAWLNGKHQVFGKVVAGEEICDVIESYGKTNGQVDGVIMISDCGETEASKNRRESYERVQTALEASAVVAAANNNNNNNNQNNVAASQSTTTGTLIGSYAPIPPSDLPAARGMPAPTPSQPNDFIYLNFAHRGTHVGRVVIELFTAALPRTAHNFKVLASGETSDYKTMFKGTPVHRILPGFCLQMGDCERQTGSGGMSVYKSRYFNDEGYLPHFTGCVATATSGTNKNNSQFYILTATDSDSFRHLHGRDVPFGRVVDGWKYVLEMERNHSRNYIITTCGVLEPEQVPTELGRDAAPQLPPIAAYAYWHTHPLNRPRITDVAPAVVSAASSTTTSTSAATASSKKNANDDDDSEHKKPLPTPDGPNGIINPPFVRAFHNGVLPTEMARFVQDFLRTIECSVCLCTFDSYGRIPCTLACGHSICFNHLHLLENCPLCREEITGKTKIKPNIVLRDLCAKFAPTDLESITISRKPQERAKTPPRTRFTNLLATTESSRLDLNAPMGPSLVARPRTPEHLRHNNEPATAPVVPPPPRITTESVPGRRTLVLRNPARNAAAATTAATGVRTTTHTCPTGCDVLRSQRRCCACMDRRPLRATERSYPVYVDGAGYQYTGTRWEHYCPTCRSKCERDYYLYSA